MKKTLLSLAVLLACATVSPAQPPGDVTIDDLDLGTWWAGPQVDRDDLRGKVVLVEIWGS